jgi:membrane protease YdiL (CAAX protease family)
VLVAFLEELVFRGYLMTQLSLVFGGNWLAAMLSLLISSIVFGLAHWYQGRSGALSTGLLGVILGGLFIWSGNNLWLPILTHGFIDTIGLGLIYLNLDVKLHRLIQR